MFDSTDIIVGLEIGTSKICAVVGEVNDSGALNVIGIGQAKSRGVRKGEIIDVSASEEDVRTAIAEAETMANVEIRSVFLGVTGGHIRGLINRGHHPIVSADRVISEEDVQDVIKNAKAVNLPHDHTPLHSIRQHFLIDGRGGIINPVGGLGAQLGVDLHVIHGNTNRLKSPVRVVSGLQLEVDDIVFNGLASSLALLSNEQKELGSIMIDMGAGTTEYVVYVNGIIKHSGVLAVGGDHVSHDLGYGLKLPLGRAEQYKLEHGSAWLDDKTKGRSITIPSDVGLPEKHIGLDNLRLIMRARLEEIFEIIEGDIASHDLLDHIGAGVFISGGGARIPHIEKLASHIFGLPAHISRTSSISGLKSALDQPEFSTAIGLAKYGSFKQKRKSSGGLFSTITDIFKR